MLSKITDDEFGEIIEVFKSGAKLGFDIYRIMKTGNIGKDTLKQHLASVINSSPVVLNGEIFDLAWFWNGKKNMPFSVFSSYDEDIKKVIMSNFEYLEKQGFVEVNHLNQSILLLKKGDNFIYSGDFIQPATLKLATLNEKLGGLSSLIAEQKNELLLDKSLSDLPIQGRQEALHKIISSDLSKNLVAFEKELNQLIDNKQPFDALVTKFTSKLENLNLKITLHTDTQGLPSPIGNLKELQKVLNKAIEDLRLIKPIKPILDSLKAVCPVYKQSEVNVLRSALQKVESEPLYVVNQAEPTQFVKIEKDKKGNVDLEYYNKGKCEYSTKNNYGIEKDYIQEDIEKKYKSFENPKIEINYNDNILTCEEVVKNGKSATQTVTSASTGVATLGVSVLTKVGTEILKEGEKMVLQQQR